MVAARQSDIGIIPSFELTRQDVAIVPGLGIAARDEVRSILLVSKKPAREIRRMAGDVSSRTSVALARIILARRFGSQPEVLSMPPELPEMLAAADAALIIGDPAMHLDPAALPYHVYDLGREWREMTDLPMVFAVWAGWKDRVDQSVIDAFHASFHFGMEHLEDIVRMESLPRGFAPDLVRRYLTSNITFELGAEELQGLELFLNYARELPRGKVAST